MYFLGDGHLREIILFIIQYQLLHAQLITNMKGFHYCVTLYQQQSQDEAEGI